MDLTLWTARELPVTAQMQRIAELNKQMCDKLFSLQDEDAWDLESSNVTNIYDEHINTIKHEGLMELYLQMDAQLTSWALGEE